MDLATVLGGLMMVAITAYVLGGGADFGGGVWDLLARGPRTARQRALIADAIGPIWEANHVWLIFAIVVLFVAFPVAFAAVTTALHVPLTVMLIGVVLRGAAFTFRTYDDHADVVQRRWSVVFAGASIVTPIMLGACVGTIASGVLRMRGNLVQTNFFEWLAPFPLALGLMTLALFAFLAAVYLTLETDDPELQDDFRARALGAGVAVGVLAWTTLLLARSGAPLVYGALLGRSWSWPFHILTGATAAAAFAALFLRRFPLARLLAVAQVTLVIWGWALSQYPYLLAPDLTFAAAAAPPQVLKPMLITVGVGMLLVVPSLAYLYYVFKRRADVPLPRSGPGAENV
jgi:cytochrome bd ubiquinol oxidase subunit II